MLRWIRTFRHFRLSQLIGRTTAGLRRRFGLSRVPSLPEPVSGALEPRGDFLFHDPWNEASSLREGKVVFLNESRMMERPWDWTADSMPLLWKFHLHYFDFLHLLGPDEREALCREWIRHNPPSDGVGWHPYPTSLRIANWCKLFDSSAPTDIHESLYCQAGYLRRNVERYLSGNHVLANARALILAGLYFEDLGEAPKWLEDGLAVYRRELPRQVLTDGGHYERSPMYHIQVLVGCLDVLNVLPEDHSSRPFLRGTVDRMREFLRDIVHPDGGIPLFNDSTLDGAPGGRAVEAYVERIGTVGRRSTREREPEDRLRSRPESGFYRYRSGDITVLITTGVVGPRHQPAHAHADVFSFELSVRGQRFVTDTGVYEYRAGEMRDYCRSTRAHNTVEVDGVDQAEVWGSFRVARRYEPTVEEATVRDGRLQFEGSFSGYSHLIGDDLVHRRRIVCDGADGRLAIEDRIDGTGMHRVTSRLHLHPDVSLERSSDGLRLQRGENAILLMASGRVTIDREFYCPRFGVKIPRRVLRLEAETVLPATLHFRMKVL